MLQQQVEGCLPLEDTDVCLQCLMLRMQGFADAHQVTYPYMFLCFPLMHAPTHGAV